MSSSLPFVWHDLLRYAHLWGYVLKWPLYFVGGWAAIFFRRWQKNRKESIARGWPSIDGLIVSGEVVPVPKTSRFLATLQYTYFVEEYRSGKYVHEFQREADADDFVRQMKDKRVQIRYHQTKPDNSVLEQSVIEQHILLTPRFG